MFLCDNGCESGLLRSSRAHTFFGNTSLGGKHEELSSDSWIRALGIGMSGK